MVLLEFFEHMKSATLSLISLTLTEQVHRFLCYHNWEQNVLHEIAPPANL